MLLDEVNCRFEFVEAISDRRQQFESLLGDFDPAPTAAKQRHLNVRFERLDLLAHGGRRDVERVGGRREIRVGGHGFKASQGPQGEPSEGRWHVKYFSTHGQTLHLSRLRGWRNLWPFDQFIGVHIMNESQVIARVAQAFLAVGMTLATGLMFFACRARICISSIVL